MGTVLDINARRVVKAHLEDWPQPAGLPLPKGCKGAACPAFAVCQGRCATTPAAGDKA